MLRFQDVGTNPGPWHPVPAVCWLLCSNVRGLAGNLSDLAVASSRYDILLCSETLVSDKCHVSELLVPGFGHPVLLRWGRMLRARGIRTRWIWSISPTQVCVCCCEMLFFRVCGVRHNLYLFSFYRHPDLDDRIFVQFSNINDCRSGWGCECLIITSCWVLQPQIVMVLQPLTSLMCLIANSWLLAGPMHVVEHLTSWWLMFLTSTGFCCSTHR